MECNIKHNYKGYLGIDMMIVEDRHLSYSATIPYCIHPLVEINFRHTMGHVALSLNNEHSIQNKIMQITFDGSHHSLKLENSTNLTFDIYPKYKR